MRRTIIRDLVCRECGSGFKIVHESTLINSPDSVEYGVLSCKCGEFPVIDGIVVTRRYPRLPKVIKKIREAKTKYQLWSTALMLIDEPYVRFVLWLSMNVRRVTGRWPWLSFWKVVTFIKNSRYGTYLKYRFSCPSFVAAIGFLPVFKKALSDGGYLLDLGSGVGHFDFLLTRYLGEERVICAEKHFMNMYLGKNYIIGSGASFIVLDADIQIPFREKMFSAILSMDAFHYIDKKQMLANEFVRALKENGTVFLIHLHNRLVNNPAKGLPSSPDEYASLFKGFDVRSFTEKGLVSGIFAGEKLDLSQRISPEEINDSDAIAMVFSKNKGIFNTYDLNEFYRSYDRVNLKGKAIISPIYMKVGDEYRLRFPCPIYEEEYYLINEFFPRSMPVSSSDEELRKKLVMIDVPEDYMRRNERLYRFRLWR